MGPEAVEAIALRWLPHLPAANVRAFAQGFINSADQVRRARADVVGEPDRDVQRARLAELLESLESASRTLGKFSARDWNNIAVAILARDEHALDGAGRMHSIRRFIPDFAESVRAALEHRSRKDVKDPGFSLFVLLAIEDYRVFFDELPPHSPKSRFVRLLEEIAPLIDDSWSGRNVASAVRQYVKGDKPSP